MSKLNKQSKLNILGLSLEQKALRYINVANRIKAETEIRSLLKDDLIPIIKKNPNQLKNFKGVPKPSVFDKHLKIDFFLEVLEKDMNRFDVTTFKKDNPKQYTKYLKKTKSVELKGKILS